MKHQTAGDLDEAKLIEGLTGERAIYKRRGEQDPEVITCIPSSLKKVKAGFVRNLGICQSRVSFQRPSFIILF